MEEKVDIVALEELLIDFTEAGHSQDGRKLFEQNPSKHFRHMRSIRLGQVIHSGEAYYR